jgi:hypothetical protein
MRLITKLYLGLELNVPVVKTYDLNKGNMELHLRTFGYMVRRRLCGS